MNKNDLICPENIVGLRDIFLPPELSKPEITQPEWGFQRGSSILVSGPPGSGKTTFALALLRTLMKNRKPDSPAPLGYYISVEVDRDRLKRMYQDRGWFANYDGSDPENKKGDQIFHEDGTKDYEGLHVIQTPLEIERPARSTEELLNHISAEISRRPAAKKNQDVYLIVDSITSLLKDSSGPGEERRQTYELLHRLRALFPERSENETEKSNLALMFLLSEHAGIHSPGAGGLPQPIPKPKVEDYVADYVVHLDTSILPLGHKLRILEFTKSQGSHIMLGQHTWVIITHGEKEGNTPFEDPFSRTIVGKSLRTKICGEIKKIEGFELPRAECAEKPEKSDNTTDDKKNQPTSKTAGTIVIARRPYVSAGEYNDYSVASSSEGVLTWSGLPGLDEMLCIKPAETPDFWINGAGKDRITKMNLMPYADHNSHGENVSSAKEAKALKVGSTTLLIGEPGAGKSSLCFPFLLHSEIQKFGSDNQNNQVAAFDESEMRLFISFENDPRSSIRDYLKHLINPHDDEDRISKVMSSTECIYRPRNLLDFNLLLLEVRSWLALCAPKSRRVVIDGVSDLLSAHDPLHVTQMLDALLATFKVFDNRNKEGPGSTILLTYEEKDLQFHRKSEALRIPADNIILLRKVDINDQSRHAIQVVKSSHPTYDRYVRELHLDRDKPLNSRIYNGFHEYSGLTTNPLSIQPARVLLEFFEENIYEAHFNQILAERLRKLYSFRFETRNITKGDIRRLSRGSSETDPQGMAPHPKADLHLKNLDEWCVKEYTEHLGRMSPPPNEKSPFIGGLHDTSDSTIPKSTVPGYVDFGMLAFHSKLIFPAKPPLPEKSAERNALKQFFKAIDEFWMGDPEPRKEVENHAIRLAPFFNPKTAEDLGSLEEKLISFSKLAWCDGCEWDSWLKEYKFTSESGLALSDCKTILSVIASKDFSDYKFEHPFAFDLETPVTATCFLLELVLAFGGKPESLDSVDNKSSLEISLSFMAFLARKKIVRKGCSLLNSSEAAFSRQYYSTFQHANSLLMAEGAIKDPGRLLLLPNLPGAPVNHSSSYSCRGAWHLGFLAATPSASLGPSILNALSSAELENLRAARGAGLPVSKRFYEFYGERGVSGAPYLKWWDVLLPGNDNHDREPRFKKPKIFDRTVFYPSTGIGGNISTKFNSVTFFDSTREALRDLIADASEGESDVKFPIDKYLKKILDNFNDKPEK